MAKLQSTKGAPGAHYFSSGAKLRKDELEPLKVHLAGRDLSLYGAPGVFSAKGLDKATKILLEHTPFPQVSAQATMLDLGCGWGPIALTLGLETMAGQVWGVDVNERALELCRLNAHELGLDSRLKVATPREVYEALADEGIDAIWSNPPVRIGKDALHELLTLWLPLLKPHGEARLVVGKNLGADPLADWIETELAFHVERYGSKQGFRLLRVYRD